MKFTQLPTTESLEPRLLLSANLVEWDIGSGDCFGDTPAEATQLDMNDDGTALVLGRINTSGDVDALQLTSPHAGLVNVTMIPAGGYGPPVSMLRVLTAQGQVLTEGTRLRGTDWAKVWFSAKPGQGFVVEAHGVGGTSGQYELRFETLIFTGNHAPVAADDAVATAADVPLVIDVLGNDSDADGDPLTVVGFTQPTGGTVSRSAGGTLTYAPASGFTGPDSFMYVICDSKGAGAAATVSVAVNDAAADGAFIESGGMVVMEAESFTGGAAGGGTAWNSQWAPTTGLAGYSGQSALEAVPNAKLHMGDTTDGPRLDYDVWFNTPGTYCVWTRMLGATGSDDSVHAGLDGQPVSYGRWGITDTSGTWHWEDCISDDQGQDRVTVTVSEAGRHTFNVWMREDGTAFDKVVLTRAAGFIPAGMGLAESPRQAGTVNHAPAAVDDAAVTSQGKAVVIDVLGNDSDADGDALAVVGFTQPSAGGVTGSGDGTLTYTPAAGFTGSDSFVYVIADDSGAEATAAVEVTVLPAGPPGGGGGPQLGGIYYIDRDGDGYGTASPLGPDADDTDPDVTTLATALAKHGSLEALLGLLGYHPERIIFVAKDGSNATGQVGNIDRPFADYNGAPGGVGPGDVVIYRQGTWQGNYVFGMGNLHGTAEKPIVFMAMPGERVVFDAITRSIGVDSSSHIVIDGFIADNTQGWYGKGIGLKYSSYITIRNVESTGHTWGMIGMQDLHHVLTEYCVFHDNPGEHGVYWGARDLPNSDLTIRSSLFYFNGRHGFQHNGRVTNLVIENNILHSNNLAGVSLIEGVRDSLVRGNLIFNNNKQGIVFYTYNDSNPAIQPYEQVNNVVEDNIIWVGRYSWNNKYQPATYSAVLFNDATGRNIDMGHNTFRNNILVTYDGPAFRFSQARYAETTAIQDNLIYRVSGDDQVMYYGGALYDFAAFENFSDGISGNTFADPNFADVSIDYYQTPEKFDFSITQ